MFAVMKYGYGNLTINKDYTCCTVQSYTELNVPLQNVY